MDISDKAVAACDIRFEPVSVNCGRKFRGDAFRVSGGYEYIRGYAGSGVDPLRTTEYAKLWSQKDGRFYYVNETYLMRREISLEDLAAAKAEYIKMQLSSTLSWCRSQMSGSSEAEVMRFARNVLRKHHRALMPAIDEAIPDTRDVVDVVRSTLTWAMSLKSGKKLYSPKKQVKIAYMALCNKDATKLDGFNEAWHMCLNLFGLPEEFQSKYIQLVTKPSSF